MGLFRTAFVFCVFNTSFLCASTIPLETVWNKDFPSKEKKISSIIDYHIGLIFSGEKYGINPNQIKCAKHNCEYIRAHVQQYLNSCIDIKQSIDYIVNEMYFKFIDLTIFNLQDYEDSFYPCTQHDLTKRLYVEYEQKRPLPPKIEYGITICLIGYFVSLIPYPPISACGYAIMLYGAEKIADGYFSELDKKFEKEYEK